MKATVLVDNKACQGCAGEWGLSVYIEYEDKVILLDAGGSPLFFVNAGKLGKDISKVDYAVLSHAHYDHSLGMETFFENNSRADFFIQEGTEANCYKKVWLIHKYIGLPRNILSDYRDRIRYVSGDYKLMDGVYIIPHKTADGRAAGKRENMFLRKHGRWEHDDFSHEQSLVFETEKGLVIFSSCSHAGAAAIIEEIAQTFPGRKEHGIIGGFHLYNKTEAEVRSLAARIRETGIEFICTGHCTGDKAYDILKEELGDSLCQLHVNKVMEF